jgi:hypothetical protein
MDIGDEFRRVQLNSTDDLDQTLLNNDWTLSKVSVCVRT